MSLSQGGDLPMSSRLLSLNDPERAHRFFQQKLEFCLGPIDLQRLMVEGKEFNLVDLRD